MRMLARSTLAAVALASVVVFGGCSTSSGGETVSRDSESQEITEAGAADVFELKVGDCMDAVDSEEVAEVPAVPCGQEHDDEIYHEFAMPDGDWPGEDAVIAAADEQCSAQFDVFVGMPYAESVLDWYPFTPTEGSWTESSDRLVQCVIYEPDVRTVGSLAGVAR